MSEIKVDTVAEKTSANGVTVDGLNIKDSKLVTANSVVTSNVTNANITSEKIADDAITLAKMASGTDGNIISYDASGNPVAVATGNDGQVLTSTGAGSPPAFETLSTGKVLQCLSTVKTDTFSTSSQSYTAVTGLSVAITPSSTSSKILVMVQICLGTNSYTAFYSLRRGSTDILLADAASNRSRTTAVINPRDTDTDRMNNAIPTVFLDSPNTTSATTYQAYIRNRTSSIAYVNRSHNDNDGATFDPRTTSTITVMEIAG